MSRPEIGEAWVVDMDSASQEGESFKIVAHFAAPDGGERAEQFVAGLPNQADVRRGRYGIDVYTGEE